MSKTFKLYSTVAGVSENRLQRTVKVISVTFAVFQLSSSLSPPVYASAPANMALKSVTLPVSQASSNLLNDCVANHTHNTHTAVHTGEKVEGDNDIHRDTDFYMSSQSHVILPWRS